MDRTKISRGKKNQQENIDKRNKHEREKKKEAIWYLENDEFYRIK